MPSRTDLVRGAVAAVLLVAAGVSLARVARLAAEPAQPATAPPAPGPARLVAVARGFGSPVLVVSPPGDPRRFVVEQAGLVRAIVGDGPAPTPLLDVRARVEAAGSEQGLLGLAFHPDFAANGRLFVNYTARGTGATVVAEHRVPPGAVAADPEERRLLVVKQRWANHNGGHVAFSPDGFLVVGMGDGGAGGDPLGSGQDRGTLLGAMLRIDVDREEGGRPYAIPPDNPFAAGGGAPEIAHIGLRNPWRWSFDRATGDLWIGDVGQNEREEIDRVPAGVLGANLGWNVQEGDACFAGDPCERGGMLPPVVDLGRTLGCSVTGGFVYRGAALPALVGSYVFGDYCGGRVVAMPLAADGRPAGPLLDLTGSAVIRGLASFGEDAAGELYVASHRDGVIWMLVPPAPPPLVPAGG